MDETSMFSILEHWKPLREILPAKDFLEEDDKYFPLFNFLYGLTEEEYQKLPARKNGEDTFLHPQNVVFNLKKAELKGGLILSIGLIHDLIEEKVDLFASKNKVNHKQLEDYGKKICLELRKKLRDFCSEDEIDIISKTIHLLTRQKKDFYYRSIANIFQHEDEKIKEMAIQVKLADRIHNILSIENFSEQERIYQCFKNIFILNNTKNFLLEKYGKKVFTYHLFSPTEKLFNKCCKATYDAFLTICHLVGNKGIQEVRSLIQMAFKKYVFEEFGLLEVGPVNEQQMHPFRLFQGVVLKYDKRLLLQWNEFNKMIEKEEKYCHKFFSKLNFTDEQISAIVDYKDAYALKEVVARLLYNHDYVLSGFLVSELDGDLIINKTLSDNSAKSV